MYIIICQQYINNKTEKKTHTDQPLLFVTVKNAVSDPQNSVFIFFFPVPICVVSFEFIVAMCE